MSAAEVGSIPNPDACPRWQSTAHPISKDGNKLRRLNSARASFLLGC